MIVAYAGRRADSLPADHQLGVRLTRLLTALSPSAVVGAASDGGDLLVLEAALARRDPPMVDLVLPTERQVFLEASVRDDWRARFDRLLAHAADFGTIVELGLPDSEDAYRQANRRILDTADRLAVG